MSIDLPPGLAAERREHILRSAVRCIALYGYDGVRLRDVSKEAAVSIGLVQHYFESRNQLIDTAITFASDELIARWDDGPHAGEPAWERAQGAVKHVATRGDLWTVCVIWIEFARAATRDEHLRERYTSVYQAWERHFRQILEDGMREGVFDPPLAPDDAVRSLLSFFDGFELEIATGVATADPEDFQRRCLGVIRTLFGLKR